MALEDKVRPSINTALDELSARVTKDVRALVDQLLTSAREARDEAPGAQSAREKALKAAREAEVAAAAAETRRRIEEVETRSRAREREAATTSLTRLLNNIRSLDGASTLTEVLDALARAAASEASRAVVLVVRHDRLFGWKANGFGASDAQPKAIELDLAEPSIASLAVKTTRSATTRENGVVALPFAQLPPDRLGLAVPVIVGGRAVAVVYADDGRGVGEQTSTSCWPDVIEALARHASRCLEALTVQK